MEICDLFVDFRGALISKNIIFKALFEFLPTKTRTWQRGLGKTTASIKTPLFVRFFRFGMQGVMRVLWKRRNSRGTAEVLWLGYEGEILIRH
jgi:hypothetical protein